jgi:MFS family permease
MLRLLTSRHLRRFFFAHLQSQLGSGAAYVALVLIAYQRFRSGWAVALVLLADFLPGIVLSAPCGALSDRCSRTALAVGADLLRAGAFVALALVPSFPATLALALVAGVGSAMFRPAVNAALPGLVTKEQRSAASALYGALSNIGLTVGPGLTALVLLFSSPAAVLAVNGATFLVSAALLSGVPLGRGSAQHGEGSVWSATSTGARAIVRIPGLRALLLIGAMTILAAALMNVAEPLLAIGPLAAGNAGYSLLVGVYGAGMVAGSLVNASAGSRIAGLRRRWLVGVALDGIGMLGSAAAPSLTWAIASFALTGLSNALIVGPELRLFQELVSERLLGRAFGVRDMLSNIAFVLAFVAAGVLLSLLGVRSLFALGGGALVAMSLFGALLFHPCETSDTPEPSPAPSGFRAPKARVPAIDLSSYAQVQGVDVPAAAG